MRRKAVVTAAAVLAAIGFSASRAQAQGFSVYEHDACTMGRAGSGVASPCSGGSAIFFNPAGIVTGQGKWNAAVGVTMIPPRGSYTDSITGLTTDLVESNIPVPNMYLTRQVGSRLAVGVGVFAPYGLTTEWPTTSPGRFLAYKSTIKSIYMQPTVAYRVSPRLQLGFGVDIVRTAVELHQRVELSSQVANPAAGLTFAMLGVPVGTDFADARLHGTGNAVGYHFGIIARPTDFLSVGARYMTGVTIEGSGYAGFTAVPTGILLAAGNPFGVPARTPLDAVLASQFTGTGRLVTQTVKAVIPMPAQFVAGIDFQLRPGLHLLADYQWTQWSKFAELPITLGVIGADTLYEAYGNSSGYRAAVEYAATPKLNLRAGLLTHNAAAPSFTVTPLLPEGARFEGVFGAGYQVNRGIRIDVAYQIIKQQDRRGRATDPPARGSDAANTGLYKFSANLFGASVAFAF